MLVQLEHAATQVRQVLGLEQSRQHLGPVHRVLRQGLRLEAGADLLLTERRALDLAEGAGLLAHVVLEL